MRPMIGNWEPPRIERLDAHEHRDIRSFRSPGLSGDLSQDLGRRALTVQIGGSLTGDEVKSRFLQDLRSAFTAGDPVDFLSDILEDSDLEQVQIIAFQVAEDAVRPGVFGYDLILREYTEPPEPPDLGFDLGASLNLSLDIDLGLDLLDLAGLVGDVPDIGPLLEPVTTAAEGLRTALGEVGTVLGGLDRTLDNAGGTP